MTSMTGHCLCNSVRFSAEAVETHHHACHCGMCRRWSGGPLFVATAQGVRFEGDADLERYASSDWAERGFCRKCGSHLFYYLKPADQYLLCVGAFDDPKPFALGREIFVDVKAPGYAFVGDHPRLTEAETLAAFSEEP